jgi:hypothetical protein
MKNVVIVDIDGTISKVGERLKYIKQGPKDWDSFYHDCFEDEPILEMVKLVHHLANKYSIVFCTGRRASCRSKTETWLKKYFVVDHLIPYYALLMRPNNDMRHDTEVKPDLLEMAGYTPDNVAFILEDRTSMVKKWRELGFTCLQVADGDF